MKVRMRELRKNVESTIDAPKEELVDNIDEMKIEEVLMGLKGLKQEEVFSFLGKNNFTPAETEMGSTGFGNYDQLASVDSADVEQLQLNFDGNFDGFQGVHAHGMLQNHASGTRNTQTLPKISEIKLKMRSEFAAAAAAADSSTHHRSTIFQANAHSWPLRKIKTEDAFPKLEDGVKVAGNFEFQRASMVWPKYPGGHTTTYSLADGYLENLREEEIIATTVEVSSDMIKDEHLEEQDFKYPVNNTYVIQSAANAGTAVDVEDKPKPIKLLIKRVENEDEAPTEELSPNDTTLRAKSKRARNPCPKRKYDDTISPPKKKRCTRKAAQAKPKEKPIINTPAAPRKKEDNDAPLIDEFDFPFTSTVHQDDDFVYPSLDLSDDEEEDVYSFNQRDDETWTPKMKMKINEVKSVRPTRDRKTKSAVAKCLEAAAMKRADADPLNPTTGRRKGAKKTQRKRSSMASASSSMAISSTSNCRKPKTISMCSMDSNLSIDSDITSDLVIDDGIVTDSQCDYTLAPNFDSSLASSNTHLDYGLNYPVPSTSSSAVYSSPSSSSFSNTLPSSSSLESSGASSTTAAATTARTPKKSKTPRSRMSTTKSSVRSVMPKNRLVNPKTCKLIQTPPSGSTQPQGNLVQKKPICKDESPVAASSSSPSTSTAVGSEKKAANSSYVTKRGKPKKGMATVKQRLGKILKMHKMFF